MKLIINKVIRITVIPILLIVLLLNIFLVYQVVNSYNFIDEINQVYKYSSNGNVDYIIYLKPNNLYNKNSLDSNQVYITNLIDHISTTFNYNLDGESEASIKGIYIIKARLHGYIRKGEEIITVWERDFPLVNHKNFSSINGEVSISENIKFNINEYNTFAQEILESTKINCDTQLTLLMDINVTGTTDKGTFEEHLTPNIVIPLNTPMFEITTNNVEKSGSIEETIQVQVPVDEKQVIFYGVIIGICGLGLIFLIFFTKSAPKKDQFEKERNKIFKKHGDRLVALNSDMDLTGAKYVRTIDDLVRFADEVERPILYKYSDNYKEINIFYVTNGDETYAFNLKDSLPKEEKAVEEVEVVSNES